LESIIGVQRVRIGLTGLAFVFILVLLGAVFTSPSNEQAITANLIDHSRLPGNASQAAPGNDALPKEPLAELGVAPGNADQNGTTGGSGATGAGGR
jgi:hypothetical protein